MQDKIMTQEEKELLLKDLCSRLPYGVKASYYGAEEECECIDIIDGIYPFDNEISIGQYGLKVEAVKPYLLPLSSMTEEQIYNSPFGYETMDTIRKNKDWTTIEIYHDDYYELVDWFNKNHFDYRGLIPMGLANDATGLNIYIY